MDETNTEVAMPHPETHPGTDTQHELLETKVIGISGMTCDKCVQTIERAFRNHRGVKEVQVNRADATAKITYDKRQTDLPALHETLLRSGYKPTGGVVS
jgi:copper chaperone CopZ